MGLKIQKKYARSTRQAGQEVDRSILKLFVIISNTNYDIIEFFCCKLPFLKLMKTLEILFKIQTRIQRERHCKYTKIQKYKIRSHIDIKNAKSQISLIFSNRDLVAFLIG